MDALLGILSNLALGVASNAIYDFIKSNVNTRLNKPQFQQRIADELALAGSTVTAATVITALEENGFVKFTDNHVEFSGQINVQGQGVTNVTGLEVSSNRSASIKPGTVITVHGVDATNVIGVKL